MSPFPAPVADVDADPFWEAARAGKLLIQRCPVTGRHQWYPRAHSIHAPDAAPEWVEASGRGTVFSFSAIHRGNHGRSEPPYICALIRLDEDVLMLSRLEGVTEDQVRIGMPVEVAYAPFSDDVTLPVFHLARGPS